MSSFACFSSSDVEIRNNSVIKVIAGYEHALCLLDTGEMYGTGCNDYGQYGSNPVFEEDISRFIGFKKVNIITNSILQNCKVIDIFTKYNFTIYLAIHNETNKQTLLVSGWNVSYYGNTDTKIIQCYFLQHLHDNLVNGKSTNETLITELTDEFIVKLVCGRFHFIVLTEDINTKEQHIYECDKNYKLSDIPVLRKSKKICDFIKSNDENNFNIKQIEAGTCCTYFVTESGKLFVVGENNLCETKELQLIPQSLFENESVAQVSDCLHIPLVLTNSGTIHKFHNASGHFKLNFGKSILQIHTTYSHGYILFEDLSIYEFDKYDAGYCTTLIDVIYKENEFDDSAMLLNDYLEQRKDYCFTIIGDKTLYIVVQKKQKKNLLIQKLKNILLSQNENGKNYFYDIDFK